MVKEMQQRLEQLRLEEERRKQEEEEKLRALEEAENRRLEKVFAFICVVVDNFFGLKSSNQFDFCFPLSWIIVMNMAQRKIKK